MPRAAVVALLLATTCVDAHVVDLPPAAARRPTHLVALAGRDEAGLTALLARQQDAASPDYRRWLTPREFGARFGAPAREVRRASRWLRAAGCRVRRFAGRGLLACVGPRYLVVPAELRGRVEHVAAPDDAPPVVLHVEAGDLRPAAVDSDGYFFTPQEFARVYGLGSAIGALVDGRGETIGIVGFSRVDPADVALFNASFALPEPQLEQLGDDTRSPGSAIELEALLDVSWSGAVAPGARIVLVVGRLVVDSLAELVDRADVGVISLSVSFCPTPSTRLLVRQSRRLFRQAAAQGQTVLSASGDSGRRSCRRTGIDPITASPFVTAVGGTIPFPVLDTTGVALGYGSEVVWSEPGGASGGGPTRRRRPKYQGRGRRRTVPDVAFPASSVYPLGVGGTVMCCVGGTSAGAPAWAGAVAQLNQVLGGRVGFMNPRLYDLARAQQAGGAPVFHDVTEGSNAFDGLRGFPAKPGYDLATGWGSMNGPVFFATFR